MTSRFEGQTLTVDWSQAIGHECSLEVKGWSDGVRATVIRGAETEPTKYSSGGCEFCVKELVSELKSKPIEVLGVRYSSKTAACDAFWISRSVVTARLRRNWSTDAAFTFPKGAQRKNK